MSGSVVSVWPCGAMWGKYWATGEKCGAMWGNVGAVCGSLGKCEEVWVSVRKCGANWAVLTSVGQCGAVWGHRKQCATLGSCLHQFFPTYIITVATDQCRARVRKTITKC